VTVSAHQVLSPRRFTIFDVGGGRRDHVPPAPQRSLQLRELAAAADQLSAVHVSLSVLWHEISRGLCKIVDGFFTSDRCLLVTQNADPASPLEGRKLEIVEAILRGVGQKSIAIELGVAPSTVALNARLALTSLGIDCRASRAHPLLMLALLASRTRESKLVGSLSFVDQGAAQLRVISVPRPDARLCELLPPAEGAVIRGLVEGASYREIARSRGTSMRTIANQIAAVFRRLRVSGRSELMLRLLADDMYEVGARSISPPAPSLGYASAS